MRYTQEEVCDFCQETLTISLDEPVQTQQDMWIYGETRVRFFEDHVRISLDDWNKFSPQIIAALKQGDMKHATRNRKNSEEVSTACG